MILNIVIGCVLLLLTTLVHAGTMVAMMRLLKVGRPYRKLPSSQSASVTLVASVVLAMFLASVVEALLWALTYLLLGAISGFESAIYFSMVTYTTLGYGDVVMEGRWRLLSAFEAANGILMFGWTTALIVAAVQRVYSVKHSPGEREERGS